MLDRFARLATRRARLVVIFAVLFFVVAGVTGGGVAEELSSGGFENPGSESADAADVLAEQFDTGVPNVLLLVTAESGNIDDPAAASAGQAVAERFDAQDHVTDVVSYWSENNAPPLRSRDGSRALIVGRIDTEDEDARNDIIEELAPAMRQDASDASPVSVQVGGVAEVFREVGTTIEDDLVRAEMIALPITLILLVIVFGSVVAATLPLITGVLSIVGTFLALQLLTGFTDVSIYALNLTTAMGLGLAIDYSMLIVARYREELRGGHEPRAAVSRTVRSAGRTVAFSALTVAASLCATLVFPFVFLRSMAYAGVAVALLAGFFSVVVLPAILMLLGHRVNALTLWKRSVTPAEHGVWSRVATLVMRRPIPIATAVIVLLLFLGAPFLNLHLTLPDDRVLPEDATSRQVHDTIRDEFASTEVGALNVVAPSTANISDAARTATIETYANVLAELPSVARVDAVTGTYCGAGLAAELGCAEGDRILGPETSERYARFDDPDGEGTFLTVVPAVEPFSDEGEQLVDDVRGAFSPFPVHVTGPGAELIDSNDSLFERLPWALAIIAAVTVVLLFMMFGSVLIPLKAMLLNLLSLSATFGAMVWIFQEGNLSGVLDFTATGGLAAAMPILMFCVAFGLSMDYEVFLLSRIKEEHDKGAGNTESVAVGLQRTGRLVTAAAVLIAVVFLAFATGGVSFMKLFGVGLTLAVLLDAFVIRGTLVPAFMRLAGEWNWWAPGPLRRFHDRFGIAEHVDLDAERDAVDDDDRSQDDTHDRPDRVPVFDSA